MKPVQDYIAKLPAVEKAVIQRVYDIAKTVVPESEEGTSYGMAALVYKGKGLMSAVMFKNHLSFFPYSGSIPEQLKDQLEGFEFSKGTVYFAVDHELPEAVIKAAATLRKAMIDAKA